jgi:hypothetical protein
MGRRNTFKVRFVYLDEKKIQEKGVQIEILKSGTDIGFRDSNDQDRFVG